MINIDDLEKIKTGFFQGSLDYTKNQPDLFLPHKYKFVSPVKVKSFLAEFKESLVNEKNILIYIHLPFCFSECVFCNSFPQKTNKVDQEIYLSSIIKEIKLYAANSILEGKTVKSIFFGGGTPTSFSNENLQDILNTIYDSIQVDRDASITTEAHPLTLSDTGRIKGLSAIGFNRVSIGCQTFDEKILKICNRRHSIKDIKNIIKMLGDLNMLNNIDMMTGLPGQTISSLKRDLEILSSIKPAAVEYIRHEVVNPLIIEIYQKNPDLLVKNDDLFEMVYMTQDWMQKMGYEQNGYYTDKKFWEYRYHWLREMPIIAFGARARSYSKTISYDKHEDIPTYIRLLAKNVLPVGRYISLSKNNQMHRSLFMNLQFKDGLSLTSFKDRFNENALDVFKDLIGHLTQFNCLKTTDSHISLTDIGAFFVEDVCDYIIDCALQFESKDLTRAPHSQGATSARL